MSRMKRKTESDMELMAMLKKYQSDGILIYFEEHLSSPREVVRTMAVHDDEVFMPDYVMDRNDRLVQIRFNKVK